MLKIPEKDKLINAYEFYNYAWNEWNRAKNSVSAGDKEDRDFIKYGDSITTIIGELAYDMKPADAVEVVHATWRLETDEEEPNPMFKLVVCSACNKTANDTYDYCPSCGAKMEGLSYGNN
jgi:rubrerythrin